MEDRRIMAVRDGRRLPPRNSRGEFRRRRSRRDRGMMDYAGDYGDVTRRGRYGDYGEDMGDYGQDMARGMRDGRGRVRSDYGEYDMNDDSDYRGGMDGHHQAMGGYRPIEAMGYFNGYYGMPEEDYARGSRMDYGYDMRGRGRMRDYGYYGDDYGDYGETLSEKELEEWNKKLFEQLDEREKQMFSKDAIMQRIHQMGKSMEGFGEKELYTATLAMYTDHKHSIGQNPDLAVKLGYDFLSDKDVAVKGAQKLAVYYDCIVEGEE